MLVRACARTAPRRYRYPINYVNGDVSESPLEQRPSEARCSEAVLSRLGKFLNGARGVEFPRNAGTPPGTAARQFN